MFLKLFKAEQKKSWMCWHTDRLCACMLLFSKSRERLGGLGGTLGKAVYVHKWLGVSVYHLKCLNLPINVHNSRKRASMACARR